MQNYHFMKNNIRLILLVTFGLVMINSIFAEEYHTPTGKGGTQNNNVEKVTAEACTPATGNTDLNLNNVRARINTGGDMWWDLIGTSKYEIPKGSGKTCMFAGALWIGGVDANGQLKVAALRYRQSGNDYWPGPLSTDGKASVDAATCQEYDKHFVITRAEVDEFISHCTGANGAFVPAQGYTIPNSILKWPAHGNTDVYHRQSFYLAPFYDANGDGVYNPSDGDYPYYDVNNSLCPTNNDNIGNPPKPTMEGNGILVDQVLKGDQTLWWVFNDKGNAHTESKGAPIGLEIRAQAFCFSTNDEINNMTFYSYEIINRSTYRLTDTYFSQWVDPDVGYSNDDYVGCDVGRGLGYQYNGTQVDGTGQPWAYGAQPPAIGVDFFQGPYMDPDGIDNPKYDQNGQQICDVSINGVNFGNGIVDDERFGMRRFVYHNNTGQGAIDAMTDPVIAIDYYNFLRGIWKDGTQMLYGGNAHAGTGAYGPQCDFMFPGDTDPCNWGTGGQPPNGPTYWTEVTAGNQPGDRRFMQSAGPFTLEPGAVNYITVGVPWARASQGGAWASVELLRVVDDKCQKLFDNCFKVLDGPDAPDLVAQELDKEVIIYITNKTSSNNYNEKFGTVIADAWDPSIISPDTVAKANRYDSLYRFEGYQIFQCADASVTAADIQNTDKARLVAQCDIKNFDKDGNPIGQLINYVYDDALASNVPVDEVDGANTGIVHSFRITDDKFATGNTRLVNFKKYYYLALAYAYNNYLKYSEEANSQIPGVSGLSGQKKVYLAGRKNINVITVIPHNPAPEAGGTVQQADYGTGPKITRIEGQGNGGLTLDLTPESINEILLNGKINNPVYENSRGPIDVEVIDPLNVESGNYNLKFNVDTVSSIDYACWTLTNTSTGETVTSDKTIKVANQQLLLDKGLSITIQQSYNPGDLTNSIDNGLIESSITFADSSKRWLLGLPDADGSGFQNWIRSGTSNDNVNAVNSDYDPTSGTVSTWVDPQEYYEKIVSGTWAPYRLCARVSMDPNSGVQGYGVAWTKYQNLNLMANLASVDIVLTSDTNKWSRCVVLETCDDSLLAEGRAKKLSMRKGLSVNRKGTPDGTGTGMGWFPGYAINVETGERLNIMFGENSWLVGENGRDMKFNPTSNLYSNLSIPLWGGEHFVYIVGHNGDAAINCPAYDGCAWIKSQLSTLNDLDKKNVYDDAMWAGIPLAAANQEWLSTDVKIRIRVTKPYKRYYSTTGTGSPNPQNNDYPMYSFTTNDIMTETGNTPQAKSALDLINIVPNPYYGYSDYEVNQLDNRVKITNLPVKCTVSIYTVNGILVRQYTKDDESTFLDWDLKNFAGIPIAGGLYLIHVKVNGVGEKVVKWFGTLRPIDLNSF